MNFVRTREGNSLISLADISEFREIDRGDGSRAVVAMLRETGEPVELARDYTLDRLVKALRPGAQRERPMTALKLAAVAAGAALLAGACALAAQPTGGAECDLTPGGKVSYSFMPGDRFAEQGSDGGPMEADDKTITLGEVVDTPETHFSAITISKSTGAYHWEASGPGWTSAIAGSCRMWGEADR